MQPARRQLTTHFPWIVVILCCLVAAIWSIVPDPLVAIGLTLIPESPLDGESGEGMDPTVVEAVRGGGIRIDFVSRRQPADG